MRKAVWGAWQDSFWRTQRLLQLRCRNGAGGAQRGRDCDTEQRATEECSLELSRHASTSRAETSTSQEWDTQMAMAMAMGTGLQLETAIARVRAVTMVMEAQRVAVRWER